MTFDPDAPAWINTLLIFVGVILLSLGGVITAAVGWWKAAQENRATPAMVERAKADTAKLISDQQSQLIDQLQEERRAYIEQLEKERAEHNKRLDMMWDDKSASRIYVGTLQNHIFQQLPPPPPDPPAGYIP